MKCRNKSNAEDTTVDGVLNGNGPLKSGRMEGKVACANSNNVDGSVENKRRRLSKRERKALKKKSSAQKKLLSEPNDIIIDAGNNGDDIEAAEHRIRLECMKSYSPIDIPEQPSIDLVSSGQKMKKSDNTTVPIDDEGGCRTLGKWFPNAILIKTISYTNTGQFITSQSNQKEQEEDLIVENPRSSLVLFYQYTTNDGSQDQTTEDRNKKWDRRQLQLLITYLSTICRRRHIGGRIRVATEGVNATLSAVDTPQCSAKAALRHLAEDLRRFSLRVFSHTDFKYLDDLPADRHFKEMKILPVQELVFYDIAEEEAPFAENPRNIDRRNIDTSGSAGGGGIHLNAKEYHKMLQKDNTVVIDVRNNYETILGRFDGQQLQDEKRSTKTKSQSENVTSSSCSSARGAEYIDPKMRKSTDFKSWLSEPETQEKLSNKTVLMYCTGGIRCERASAYLKREMGDKVEGVYQLKGGIERYLKTFKDGGFWRGKNFVFDKREAVGIDNPHGDGGVLRREDRKKEKKKREKQAENDGDKSLLLARCCVCGEPWDRYVGKKKCLTCGVPVLMCEKCMSLKADKTPGMELKVRCNLCVEENITVLANEVEFTANGIKSKLVPGMNVGDHAIRARKSPAGTGADKCQDQSETPQKEERRNTSVFRPGKAAESVLKWGGGHAVKKKKLNKMKRRLCQFGANCVRKDCFFYHPNRDQVEPNQLQETMTKSRQRYNESIEE